MNKKLGPEKKLKIALSRESSLRAIAGEYGVHHSSIDDIFKESEAILKQYWQEKSARNGRPSQPKDAKAEALARAESQQKELIKQLAIKQMRLDWFELQLKWAKERAREKSKKRKKKQLKKKKKLNCSN